MKKENILYWLIVFMVAGHQLIYCPATAYSQSIEDCTIGVAISNASSDGRPLLWKTRDSSSRDNEVYYNTSYKYKFISVVSAGWDYSWMGVNEKGFAVLNSYSPDLPGDKSENGKIMRDALGVCATVADFENFLDSTNVSGRHTQSNYGVIDTTGAAVIYETGDSVYWKFDANDTSHAPNGYILRANFSVNGGGSSGIERYNRTVQLISEFYNGDSLNHKSLLRYQMRDFSDYSSEPVSVPFPQSWTGDSPYGYIDANVSICRKSSVSSAVIQGVLPGEPSKLTTMWTILGQPSTAIAVPYWPVGETPPAANGDTTAPLCDIAGQIRTLLFDDAQYPDYLDSYKLRDDEGNGLWSQTFPAEDSILCSAEVMLNNWRTNTLNIDEMLTAEASFADYALLKMEQAYASMITGIADNCDDVLPLTFALYQNYPNPFNPQTTIKYFLPKSSDVSLKIYNSLGQEIKTIVNKEQNAGEYSVVWNGMDNNGKGVSSGIYFYRMRSDGFTSVKRMLLIK